MTVVTISRELGSLGTRIAEAVGAALGVPCIDKEVLAEMARQAGVQVEVIVEAEEKLMSGAGSSARRCARCSRLIRANVPVLWIRKLMLDR